MAASTRPRYKKVLSCDEQPKTSGEEPEERHEMSKKLAHVVTTGGTHRHRAARRGRACGFAGPVRDAARRNPKAHGGVRYFETCACGAVKVVNRNGSHAEHGQWSTQ